MLGDNASRCGHSMLHITLALLAGLVLFPRAGSCDGGAPLLLLVDTYLFVVGQVWIISSEWWLLKRKLGARAPSLIGVVIIMNLVSTLGGAILLPMLWATISIVLAYVFLQGTFSELVVACGTWYMGDRARFPDLAIAATAAGFVATFFATVAIERYLLSRWLTKHALPTDQVSRWTYHLNLLSYAGLVLLMIATMLLGE